jgi:maltooligosyltrehalose trehalohydrolase
LIDAAHARSMMVFLDVVYNHFGPEGNFLGLYVPLDSPSHESAWGKGLNLDDEGAAMVRNFLISSARYWLNEFHFDGLRFDAVHAIEDVGPKHFLQEMAEKVRAATDGRYVHLIVENSSNQAGWLKRGHDGEPWLYTAQWSDDIHHGLHHFATGERGGYYADYAGRLDLLGRALAEGLGYQGEKTPEGVVKGEPIGDLPATAFVSYIQDHDQVGNRPLGDRLGAITSNDALRALTATYLLAPQIPLLFMGEEWDSRQPFLYFTDMSPELGEKIREGRQKEFEKSPDGKDHSEDLPDPNSESSFLASKLDWAEKDKAAGAAHRKFYQTLLKIRHTEIVPRLSQMAHNTGQYEVVGGQVLRVQWALGDGSILHLVANFAGKAADGVYLPPGRHLWSEGEIDGQTFKGWALLWSLDDPTHSQGPRVGQEGLANP